MSGRKQEQLLTLFAELNQEFCSIKTSVERFESKLNTFRTVLTTQDAYNNTSQDNVNNNESHSHESSFVPPTNCSSNIPSNTSIADSKTGTAETPSLLATVDNIAIDASVSDHNQSNLKLRELKIDIDHDRYQSHSDEKEEKQENQATSQIFIADTDDDNDDGCKITKITDNAVTVSNLKEQKKLLPNYFHDWFDSHVMYLSVNGISNIKIIVNIFQHLETLSVNKSNKLNEFKQCVSTMCQIFSKIVDNPKFLKYRKIRIENKLFKKRISNIVGSNLLLIHCQFKLEIVRNFGRDREDQSYYILNDSISMDLIKLISSFIICYQKYIQTEQFFEQLQYTKIKQKQLNTPLNKIRKQRLNRFGDLRNHNVTYPAIANVPNNSANTHVANTNECSNKNGYENGRFPKGKGKGNGKENEKGNKKRGGIRRGRMVTLRDIENMRKKDDVNRCIEIGKEALRLTNKFRGKHKLVELKWHDFLASIGKKHSIDMATHIAPFNHDGFESRVKQYPFWETISSGENLARNNGDTIEKVARIAVNGWIKSPGHKKNLLGNYNLCGIGVYRVFGTNDFYLTQMFALAYK